LIVVVQIFVSQSQSIETLRHQLLYPMLDPVRAPIIGKAGRQTCRQIQPLLDLSQ
jgi:hypothetical protein